MNLKKIMIMGILILCIVCSGCNGATETDETAYVVAVGIDKSKTADMIDVTYQIALPKVVGGEGGGKGLEEMYQIATITAPSLAEARNLLNSIIVLRPTLVHVKALVIGDELARNGLIKVLGPVTRFREFRGSMFVMVVNDGTAQEFLRSHKSLFELTAAKYYEMMMTTATETGYFIKSSLHQFNTRLKSYSGQSYATLVSVNPNIMQGKSEGKSISGQKQKAFTAGNIPRKGYNPVDFAGTAIFNGDRMVGTLNNQQTRILAMMLNDFYSGYIVVEDPLAPQYSVNIDLRLGRKPKIIANIIDGKPSIKVQLILEGEITSIASGINYESTDYTRLLEQQISNVIAEEAKSFIEYTQRKNCDVVGFGYYFRPLFNTIQEYENYNWLNKYEQAEVLVEVKTIIRRTGLLWRTVPVRSGE